MQDNEYVKRDISWLYFNHRVLQEAKDLDVPLYERIKFLAIFSSNLDEYFRVRVASLRSFKELKKKTRRELDLRPKRELREIRRIVEEQQTEFGRIFRKEIIPALRQNGIHLITEQEFTEGQLAFAKQFFEENVKQHLQPTILEKDSTESPFLENKVLYFVAESADSEKLAIVNIPSDEVQRFIILPAPDDNHYITFLDDIIRSNLADYLQMEIQAAYSIKLSRDAEIYIDDEFDGDLVEKIREGLKDRNAGAPTRFLYDSSMPPRLLHKLKDVFHLTKSDLVPGARYHNFNDFFSFPDPSENPALHSRPLPPLPHPVLEGADSLLAVVRRQDVMLHFPYQRYDYIPQMIREAADTPEVKSLKITLYRVADRSDVVENLLYALEKGKKVTVFIEAKARFDEESNLFWGEELEKAGARVQYSYPGIKVHTKLLLIKEGSGENARFYSYLGTGNFNEKTATLYADHALITVDERFGSDVDKVFKVLEGKMIIPRCKHLLVAPFTLRDGFIKLIDQEIRNAKKGKPAYMILKMNSLEEKSMVEKLYEASRAGVKIQMIVRGICSLVPGVPGLSENIEVISIIDRFLEHSRVYIFGNNGDEKMYTASADWMTRNLYRRIEVAIPIYDPEIYAELREIINIQLADNTKARLINATQNNYYKMAKPGEPKVRSQIDIYRYLRGKGVGELGSGSVGG